MTTKKYHDIYVNVLHLFKTEVETEEITDRVRLDWVRNHDGELRLAGIEILEARSIEVDGERVSFDEK